MIPVDEYIKLELGWRDIGQIEDDGSETNIGDPDLVGMFCDGPYEELEEGCYRRLPTNTVSEYY